MPFPFLGDLMNSYFNKKLLEGGVAMLQAFIDGATAHLLSLMSDTIFNTQPIKSYIDYTEFLRATQRVAVLIIPIYIIFRTVSQQIGNELHEESLQMKIYKSIASVFFVYFIPYFAENVLITLNNAAVKAVLTSGTVIDVDSFLGILNGLMGGLDVNTNLNAYLFVLLIVLIIIVVFIILGLVAAMRIFELAIAIVFAPLACISVINRGDTLNIWFREFLSICFTQTLHAFALRALLGIIDFNRGFLLNSVLLVGGVVVMIKSPKILRNLVYSTGSGNTVVQAAGSVTRSVMMKNMIFKK